MTPERAIKILAEQIVEPLGEDQEVLDAYRMGAEAIGCCMIGKKPHNDHGRMICSECSETVKRYYDYCQGCGQKIDWSETMDKEELKPCPFCGYDAFINRFAGGIDGYSISCSAIEYCGATQEKFDTEEEAIEAWNRRVDNG